MYLVTRGPHSVEIFEVFVSLSMLKDAMKFTSVLTRCTVNQFHEIQNKCEWILIFPHRLGLTCTFKLQRDNSRKQILENEVY